MSFAPPSPAGSPPPEPLGGPATASPPPPPRSTPIPGFETPDAPLLPGNAGATPPPRPADFVNMAGGVAAPPPVTERTRSWLGIVVVILLVLAPLAGLGVGVWAFLDSRDTEDRADQAIEDAQQTVDSLLAQAQDEIDSITVPGVSLPTVTVPGPTEPPATAPPAVSFFADGGAPALIADFEAAISGDPSRFLQIVIYPDDAFAQAQDANIPTHVDDYPWRDGAVGASSPVRLVGNGDLEASLWSAADVDWTFIARAVAEAPGLTTVEEGAVTHIIVERSVFDPNFSIVVRVYVSGPRSSAYIEYTPAGVVSKVMQ